MYTPIEEKLITGRISLMFRTSFFGTIASYMKLIEASDWCSTAATDGRNFFYNSEFIDKLSKPNIEWLFAHEILHCALDHLGRTGKRHKELSNIAQDFAVNQILADESIGEAITVIPICFDAKYKGLTWEEIYDSLYNEITSKCISNGGISDSDVNSIGKTIDIHISNDNSEDSSNRPSYSEEELNKIREEFKYKMIQAAASAGTVPNAISRIITQLTQPIVDWRNVLNMNIQSCIRSNYSFASINKKHQGSGIVLPGMVVETAIHVTIALDLSGSISDEVAQKSISEVSGIVAQYAEYTIEIMCFDTEVYNFQVITNDSANTLYNYELVGNGGTDFDCIFKYLKEHNNVPKVLIIVSDGYTENWGDPNYTDTVFLIYQNPACQPPYGQVVHYR